MKSKEEILTRISEIEAKKRKAFSDCKSQGGANIRIGAFYNYVINELKWVIEEGE
jgi:hypothetical protein